MMMIVSPPSTVESFGWADFPVTATTLLDNVCRPRHQVIEMPKYTIDVSSDATASTLEALDWCDDDSFLSELAEEEGEAVSVEQIPDTFSDDVKSRRRVGFAMVHIREHNVIVGVHPLASGGYALELGWEYSDSTEHCSVDLYEKAKSQRTTLRRLSPLERRFRIAELSGDSMLEVAQQEQLLRTASQSRNSRQSLVESSTGLLKKQVNRSTSFTQLSALV